jgi:hypothetical protein
VAVETSSTGSAASLSASSAIVERLRSPLVWPEVDAGIDRGLIVDAEERAGDECIEGDPVVLALEDMSVEVEETWSRRFQDAHWVAKTSLLQ